MEVWTNTAKGLEEGGLNVKQQDIWRMIIMTTITIKKPMIIEDKRNETGRDIRSSQIIVVKVNAQNGIGGKRAFEEGHRDIGSSQPGVTQSPPNYDPDYQGRLLG